MIVESKNIQIENLNAGISNLQAIHEENQQRGEYMAKKYDTELKKSRSDLESLKK